MFSVVQLLSKWEKHEMAWNDQTADTDAGYMSMNHDTFLGGGGWEDFKSTAAFIF